MDCSNQSGPRLKYDLRKFQHPTIVRHKRTSIPASAHIIISSCSRPPKFQVDREGMLALATTVLLRAAIYSTIMIYSLAAAVLKRLVDIRNGNRIAQSPGDDAEDLEVPLAETLDQQVRYHGFVSFMTRIETTDGFKCDLCVIKPFDGDRASKLPVLFIPGLFNSAWSFVARGHRALPFELARQGHPVYLLNGRGTFDRHHIHNCGDRFEWGVDALANDVIAAIGALPTREFAVVSHSQGGAAFLFALAKIPQLAEACQVWLALHPAIYLKQWSSFELKFVSTLHRLCPRAFTALFGETAFLPMIGSTTVLRVLRSMIPDALWKVAGELLLSQLFGWNVNRMTPQTRLQYFRTMPACVSSVRCQSHWFLMFDSKTFSPISALMNWNGKPGQVRGALNVQQMAQPPTIVVHGDQDQLIDIKTTVEHLRPIKTVILQGGGHLDGVLAQEHAQLADQQLIEFFERAASH